MYLFNRRFQEVTISWMEVDKNVIKVSAIQGELSSMGQGCTLIQEHLARLQKDFNFGPLMAKEGEGPRLTDLLINLKHPTDHSLGQSIHMEG